MEVGVLASKTHAMVSRKKMLCKADASTSPRTNGLTEGDTKEHRANVDDSVKKPGDLANLPSNLVVAIQCRHNNNLRPHDEHKRDVVDPAVDGVEVVEAEFGVVYEKKGGARQ